ncbi:MAG: DUF2335 domain-containing protein [Leptospiraceae bacterium]|nr:DUF2335 domain-containing protein [Leptospiraceae bacterium]
MSRRKPKQNTGHVAQFQATFTGPLPPPAIIERYDAVLPGAAERILKMAENQSAHRHEIEKTVIKQNGLKSLLGQIFGLVIAMTVICGGFWMIYLGKSILGLSLVIGSLAALAAVFVVGRARQGSERAQKQKMFQ